MARHAAGDNLQQLAARDGLTRYNAPMCRRRFADGIIESRKHNHADFRVRVPRHDRQLQAVEGAQPDT